MKIIGCQLNFKIGDFEYNTNKILKSIEEHGNECDLLVFSELCISGYPPHDLMYERDFMNGQFEQYGRIIEISKDINAAIVVGIIKQGKLKPFKNSLDVIYKGEVIFTYDKMLLPDYDIFDEYRHFDAGKKPGIFKFKNEIIQFAICEDLWFKDSRCYETDPFENTECDIIIAINASPSLLGKLEKRMDLCIELSKRKNCDLLYVNQVGGYDDVVFDGGSFYLENGDQGDFCRLFEEDVLTNGWQNPYDCMEKNEFIHRQLVFGINEYCEKCGFKKVVVGSSGGIDSALVLTLAVAALGKENVEAITMPSKYSSEGSINDSITLCKNLGIQLYNYQIKSIIDSVEKNFYADLNQDFTGLANENTQARIRGTLLMAYSNKTGALVLSTGNKSEMSVGYCTLYGDMNGGLAPISDLYKTEVFALSKWINRNKEIIPWNIINKPPSAELAPNQKDTDSLPDYSVLDTILEELIEGECSEIKESKYLKLKSKIHKMILRNEFKRRQAAPTIKIHNKSYGYGRRIPLAQNYKLFNE